MKKFIKSILIVLAIVLGLGVQQSQAQSVKLFFGDLLNGAANGAALGGATMALQNSGDIAPVRVGVGLGVLYGAGIGLYDNSIVPKGQQFYISGTFNDGRNSTIIVLLDTFYGAVGGATIGGAISLIANDPILTGVQYGSGAGAWLGFGFGLIDAFVLAEGPNELQTLSNSKKLNHAEGLVQLSNPSDKVNIGLVHPTIFSQKEIKTNAIKTNYNMGVQLLNINVGL